MMLRHDLSVLTHTYEAPAGTGAFLFSELHFAKSLRLPFLGKQLPGIF